LALLLLSVPLNARAAGINEYPTTGEPWGIAFDTARNHIWVAEPNCDSSPVCNKPPPGLIGRYTLSDPSTGQKDFQPPAKYNPVFVAVDSSGTVWFTDPTHNAIGKLVPSTN